MQLNNITSDICNQQNETQIKQAFKDDIWIENEDLRVNINNQGFISSIENK